MAWVTDKKFIVGIAVGALVVPWALAKWRSR